MKVDVSIANKQVTEDVSVETLTHQLVQNTEDPRPTVSDTQV
jgi:hypothetical protein